MSRRYTSGQFARLCHTTKETLFHYDRLGLLRPQLKGENGYRYYDVRQFLQFDMITLFKDTGTPLKEMRACLAAAAEGDILPLLEEQAGRLAEERRRLAEREQLVASLLHVVREARATEPDRLLLRDMPASRWERLPQPMQELETEAGMIQASGVLHGELPSYGTHARSAHGARLRTGRFSGRQAGGGLSFRPSR